MLEHQQYHTGRKNERLLFQMISKESLLKSKAKKAMWNSGWCDVCLVWYTKKEHGLPVSRPIIKKRQL